MNFKVIDDSPHSAEIKIIGVGGGGGNAVEHMVSANLTGVSFYCINTDAQALSNFSQKEESINTKIEFYTIGDTVTNGLGAGANPEKGKQAALEDREEIQKICSGADMVFITAGMGGGTGTGAAPVVAEVAKELGILTVAVVTRPFPFEGKKRMNVAQNGILELSKYVDSLITIPNEKLLSVLGKGVTLLDAFKAANNVLLSAVQGISELITRPGLINVDFADVHTVMTIAQTGTAMMGSGIASGEDRAKEAAKMAISSPLLEDVDLTGAAGLLVNITASKNMSIGEFQDVGTVISSITSDDANIVMGTVIDDEMNDKLRVTVVATGLTEKSNHNNKININTKTEISSVAKEEQKQQDNNESESIIQAATNLKTNFGDDLDYLDIPAFLRRQEKEEIE